MGYMMMASLLALVLSIVPYVAQANDYWENPDTLVMNESVPVCWSLENLEDYVDEYLFIYDYSSSTGRQEGVPWVLPVQGVCYPFDFSEKLYAFKKPVTANVAALVSASMTAAPTSDVSDVLGQPDQYLDQYEAFGLYAEEKGFSAPAANIFAIRYSTKEMVYIVPVAIKDILPTRYIPGEGIVGMGALWEPEFPVWSDVRFTEAKSIIETLADDLGKTLAQCDTRQRVEVRTSVGFEHGLTSLISGVTDDGAPLNMYTNSVDVWHTERYGPIASTIYGVDSIEVMGCTKSVQSFLHQSRERIERFDSHMAALEGEYGGMPYNSNYEPRVTFFIPKRDSTDYAELVAFAYYDKAPKIDTEQLKYASVPTPLRQEVGAIAAPTLSTVATTTQAVPSDFILQTAEIPYRATAAPEQLPIEQEVIAPVTSTPTPPPNDPGELVYFVALPLVGFIGLAYFVTRRKQAGDVASDDGANNCTDA